jgi:Terminase RNaseH-like domain
MQIKIILPSLHQAQLKIKSERKRFNVLDCGRRFGKNILLQDWAIETALAQGQPSAWGAPTYKMLMDDWKSIKSILSPVIVRQSEQEKTMDLVGGGRLDFWSLDNPNMIRGRHYKRFTINEAAFVPNLVEIFDMIIRPTLIDLIGNADFAGTPKGMNGFWQLFNRTGEEWMRWQMSSYSNPHIPKSELDTMRTSMTERTFAQEIEAQFLEDGGGVFRRIREAATLQVQEPIIADVENNISAHQYIIGVDWGRSNDATVYSVFDVGSRQQVKMDRMVDTDYATQRTRLKALSDNYNQAVIIAESNSIGQPNIEALRNMGLSVQGFTTTNATKANIIQSLELAFERGDIKILNDGIQTTELMAYEGDKLPSGLIRYGAPEGMHDDTVMAMAIAWHGIQSGEMEVEENWLYS